MKNNLKMMIITVISGFTVSSVNSQTVWENHLNETDGVFVAKVMLPKNAITEYDMNARKGTDEEICHKLFKMSVSFIDSKTKKKIKFYDMNNAWPGLLPYKMLMSDELFKLDNNFYYEPKILKNYSKYIEDEHETILIENRQINKYKLRTKHRSKIFTIFYKKFNCNGYSYNIFLDFAEEK